MNKSVQFKVFLHRKTLSCLLSFAAGLCLYANSAAAMTETHVAQQSEAALQDGRITLDVANRPIRYILEEINRQANVEFMLREDIAQSLSSLSVKVSNASVSEAMDSLLAGTGFTYTLNDGTIIILRQTAERATQQQRAFILRGTVLDNENNHPIIGATVILLRTGTGATTDASGNFQVQVVAGDVLEVRYVGKIMRTLTVENDRPVVIRLADDTINIDDVVITGFGEVNRSSFTGNAVMIKGEDLLKISRSNVFQALQVYDPSFSIQDNNMWGSDPNARPEINLRGGSSLGKRPVEFNEDGRFERIDLRRNNLENNPNIPLFIIDDFEASYEEAYSLNVNRIEAVTILKDAAATALYGSRAANGVVIITTKAPAAGKYIVTYDMEGSFTFPDLTDYDMLNAAEKLEVERLAGAYVYSPDERDTPGNILSAQFEYDKEYQAKLAEVMRGVNTDWLSKPLRTVFNHKHAISISGGMESLRFRVDASYDTDAGVMKGSFNNTTGIGLRLDYTHKGLTIRNQTLFSGSKAENSPYGNFSTFVNQLPYDTYLAEDGSVKPYIMAWDSPRQKPNPMYEPSLGNYDRKVGETITNNLYLIWRLAKGFRWDAKFGISKSNSNSKAFLDPNSLQNDIPLSDQQLSSGRLNDSYNNAVNWEFQSDLEYSLSANSHYFRALANVGVRQEKTNSHSALFRNFPSGSLSSPNFAQTQDDKTRYDDAIIRTVSMRLSANYSYNDIYLADFSISHEGSSQFGTNKRFATFGSVGAGLNIHNYEFMRDWGFFNELKLRGSWGPTGNVGFSAHQALITYRMFGDEWYKTGHGASLEAFGNPDLRWETTYQTNIGLDAVLLGGRVTLKADFYNKKTVDTLNDVTIPSSTGFSTYKDNVGEIQNRGYELYLNVAAIRRQDVGLNLFANLVHNRGKILKISDSMKEYNRMVQELFSDNRDGNTAPGEDGISFPLPAVTAPLLQYEEGGSLHSIWAVRSLGINPADGREIFLQRNGQITTQWNNFDQIIVGTTEPKAKGSFGFNFSYKRFSAFATFMYQFGGQIYNQTLADKVENVNVYRNNVDRRVMEERWQKPGDKAKYRSLVTGRNSTEFTYTQPTSRFVQDDNYLKWNSLNLTYDFSERVLDALNLSRLQFTAGMNDIFTLESSKRERGINYPFARTINFSLRLEF